MRNRIAAAVGAGALGGMLSLWLGAQTSSTVVNGLRLVDGSGQPYAEITKSSTQAAQLTFYNASGKALLKVGLGPDGLPQIALLSAKGASAPKLVMKLEGENQSAMIIWKDNHAKDRMIMGLDPTSQTEDPFLITYDRDGKKTAIFGDYP